MVEIKQAFDALHLLVALAGVFSKIDSSPEKEKRFKTFPNVMKDFSHPNMPPM